MDPPRRFVLGALGLAGAALAHALLTWPARSTAALFVGGALVAFAAEVVAVGLGLLRHHERPQVAGVPVAVVVAWPAIVYVAYRAAALLVGPGTGAAAIAALAATLADLLVVEPRAIAAGRWDYPASPASRPGLGGAPWWNAVGWLAIVFVTAMLAVAAG